MVLENKNPLYIKNCSLVINEIPTVDYFCTQIVLPTVSVDAIQRGTPLTKHQVHGDTLIFTPLSIEFTIDEDMRNYEELFNWICRYSTPAKSEQYIEGLTGPTRPHAFQYSDGSAILMTNKDNPNVFFEFESMFPTDLGTIDFNLKVDKPTVATCTATFNYTKFTLKRVDQT